MPEQESPGRDLVRGAERLLIHVAAIVVGVILMVVGLAMGVTVVMLPVGVGVGFVGLLVFLWGLFGRAQAQSTPPPPTDSP